MLTVAGVSKVFQTRGGEVCALEPVELTVERGEFLTLVGPSGCGKSTLLQIMGGLLPASAGTVRLDGAPVDRPSSRIIYLFQQYTKSLFPWLNVRANVAFGLKHRHQLSAQAKTAVDRHIAEVGLEGFEEHYPWQLSGGMQQRVALARALVCRPDILLMDEPFSSVDALTRNDLQDLVLRLWREEELTVAFVTHDVDEAIYLSDRVLAFTGSPGRVASETAIDLPRPRGQVSTRALPEFHAHREALYREVTRRAQAAPQPGGQHTETPAAGR